ncbi:triose-phosphate transporter family-domain-containing protein [Rhodotorula diobovata]|uniref:Triose-phosphate transporter family-domain-containing protein n=1 Tax=Rhodotorula diobovata TaxID=5288 RepID=A0A5C5FYM3_9BASI|nr:triose-phosphate transporter family-domain-containing protein [Rhodotorula diobovata]
MCAYSAGPPWANRVEAARGGGVRARNARQSRLQSSVGLSLTSPPPSAPGPRPRASSRDRPRALTRAGYIIMIWIALSSSVILQNAYILRTMRFNYPIALTTWHLVYATVGTRLLRRFTSMLDDVQNVQMSWDRWFKNIVPIGALFSGSLIFNNFAYLTLSVSFIQMLKAFTSVAVLGMSVLFGLEQMQPRKFVIVIAISCGVALASYGEIDFDMTGFLCQATGIAFEACRLVSIQKLLTGLKMGPLVSLYYFAPVCAALNLLLIPIFEGTAPFQDALDVVGLPILVGNASTAFLLNVAVVFLIGCASSLVLTLSGVIKDILLVLGSVILMGSTVTFTQALGYGIALGGLVVFKLPQETTDKAWLQVRAALGR